MSSRQDSSDVLQQLRALKDRPRVWESYNPFGFSVGDDIIVVDKSTREIDGHGVVTAIKWNKVTFKASDRDSEPSFILRSDGWYYLWDGTHFSTRGPVHEIWPAKEDLITVKVKN